MSHALCMQDWVVVGGNASTVVQDDCDLVDLLGYQAAAMYLDISSVTNAGVSTNINFETSPARIDSIFTANQVLRFTVTPGSLGVQPISVFRFSDTIPLARYLRWAVTFTGAGACAVTFRIWLTLHQAGW